MSSADSLALRRFGGTCDSPDTAELVLPCDSVTVDALKAAQPRDRYLSFKCYQDRYLLARAEVTDQTGVGCPVALDIADRYLAAAAAGQTQGTATHWVSGEWTCSKYAFPDRANASNPLQCERSTDKGVVRLGNNW